MGLVSIQLPLTRLVKLSKTAAHNSRSFGGITHVVSQLDLLGPALNVKTP